MIPQTLMSLEKKLDDEKKEFLRPTWPKFDGHYNRADGCGCGMGSSLSSDYRRHYLLCGEADPCPATNDQRAYTGYFRGTDGWPGGYQRDNSRSGMDPRQPGLGLPGGPGTDTDP
jgi:hypothetical protein